MQSINTTTMTVPSTVPTSVFANVLSSKSIKLQWTIQWSPEHEIIEGFFVGYRSFDPTVLTSSTMAPLLPAAHQQNSAARHSRTSTNDSLHLPQDKQVASSPTQSTFTYKTIRLAPTQPIGSNNHRHQPPNEQPNLVPGGSVADAPPLLAPVSSITKTIPIGSMSQMQTSGLNNNQQQQSHEQLSQQIVVSSFEYIINGLERNTEYSILIQCFNRKGAGPSSDPVVFRTLSHGKSTASKLNLLNWATKLTSLSLSH